MKRENPITNNPTPAEPLERAEALALDLAYGASVRAWLPRSIRWVFTTGYSFIFIRHNLTDQEIAEAENLQNKLNEKWGKDYPNFELMETLGYVTREESTYQLTHAALDLLKEPSHPPNIFISYKRGESSAFALLIEARLKLVGNPNPYLDKLLIPGTKWNNDLKQRVEAAKYFILLVHPDASKSTFIQDELRWAKESGKIIISITYDGVDINNCGFEGLGEYQAIAIKGISADDYEQAVNALLNALGYATY